MALQRIPGCGIAFPKIGLNMTPVGAVATSGSLDAAGEKIAFSGYLYINGAPAGTKTISTSGGKIHFMAETSVVWADAGTTVRVGLQDWSTSTGPDLEPDGTFDVYADLVPGTETVTAGAWASFAMESGTKSLAHGDKVSVVCDMTARGGSDVFAARMSAGVIGIPAISHNTSSTWVAVNGSPICLIEFDDGTLATLSGAMTRRTQTDEAFQDSTNPDERGLIFQVPFSCKISGFWLSAAGAATADFSLKFYSDPLGTPSAIATITMLGEQFPHSNATVEAPIQIELASGSEIELSPNTDYCLAVKATGSSNVSLRTHVLENAAYRFAFPGGTQLRKGHRNADSGAFTETTTIIPEMGVIISHLDDGVQVGGSGGLLMPNLRGNAQ